MTVCWNERRGLGEGGGGGGGHTMGGGGPATRRRGTIYIYIYPVNGVITYSFSGFESTEWEQSDLCPRPACQAGRPILSVDLRWSCKPELYKST